MKRVAAFAYAGEADMLECHLTELGDLFDHFVIVEGDVDHGAGQPKPWHYLEHETRFAPWADKIVYVQATGLPPAPENDAWSREIAQRERTGQGLAQLDLDPDDIVFYGDVDEIPSRLAAKYATPAGFCVLGMRFHPFAVDWLHPYEWPGVVVGRYAKITSFAAMRALRGILSVDPDPRKTIHDAGWHLSWVTDTLAAKQHKITTFCHPEIRPTWEPHLDDCWATGIHVDGTALEPVEVVDGEWPRWIVEGHAPEGWFRPRGVTRPRPNVRPAQAFAPPSVLLPSITGTGTTTWAL